MKPILAVAAAAALLLVACAEKPAHHARGSAADRALCRQRVQEVYNKRNPADIYRQDTFLGETRDAPFATSVLVEQPSAGLAERYQQDTMFDDCMRGTSGNIGTNPAAPEPAQAAPPPPSPGGASPRSCRLRSAAGPGLAGRAKSRSLPANSDSRSCCMAATCCFIATRKHYPRYISIKR
jgi:hypothetical protein